MSKETWERLLFEERINKMPYFGTSGENQLYKKTVEVAEKITALLKKEKLTYMQAEEALECTQALLKYLPLDD